MTDTDDPRPTRPATMADIATHLGISRQLVSIVLRDVPGASQQTRERVRAAAKELGFAPHAGAQAMRRAKSRDLGVVFSPDHPTEHEIVEAIYPAAADRGYDVILSAQTATRSTQTCVEELVGHRCAALIVIGSDLKHAGLSRIADRCSMPVVDVGYGRRNDAYDVVRSSGDVGIEEMVDALVGVGHREIAYVDARSMPSAALRRRGYQTGMSAHGLTADILAMTGDYRIGGYFEETGASAAKELLERPALPTAVVVPNDNAAVGLLQTLVRSGVRVPQDISVTGFDDAPMARMSFVDLTTVRQDPHSMGFAAVKAAVARIEDPSRDPQEIVVRTSIITRGSVAAPRG